MKAKIRTLLGFTCLILIPLLINNCSTFLVEAPVELLTSRFTRITESNADYEVADVFSAFYDSVQEPEEIFGAPISHPFTNPENNTVTQYFDNFRLEANVDPLGKVTVIISDLGNQLFDPSEKTLLIIDENCSFLPDSEIPLCHEFRNYYELHNGDLLFGQPVSHVFQQEDHYYQYFENACLIWDPISNAVSLAPLGDLYLSSKEPLRYTITDAVGPASMIIESAPTGELTVLYTVEHPFISPTWEQNVKIIVTDEDGNPIENASITAWVILPNGQYEIYRPTDTNQQGVSSFTIHALASTGVAHNDLIKMLIEVNADGVSTQVVGWFRIWL